MTSGPIALSPDDGALRAHLTEAQWQQVVTRVRSGQSTDLPLWAEPYARLAESGDPPEQAETSDAEVADTAVDDTVLDAVRVDGAVLGVEVASSQREVGLLGMVRTDLVTGSGIVRRIRTVPGGGAQASTLVEGIEVSGFGVERLLDEVMRLVPPVEPTVEVAPAAIPQELSVALGAAMRRRDQEVIDAICGDLGLGEPPPIIASLVHSLTGSLSVAMRSADRSDVTVASWMLADCGWVEIEVDSDDIVHHHPRRRDEVRTRLLSGLAGRVDDVLKDGAGPGCQPPPGDDPA